RRSRESDVVVLEAVPGEQHEEHRGEDVRERQRARDVPLELVERDGEDREEEEPLEHGLHEDALARRALRERHRVARHAVPPTRSAISSTRARRESRSSSCGASSTEGSPPFAKRPCSSTRADRIASTSSGAATTPDAVSRMSAAAAPSGGTTARIG